MMTISFPRRVSETKRLYTVKPVMVIGLVLIYLTGVAGAESSGEQKAGKMPSQNEYVVNTFPAELVVQNDALSPVQITVSPPLNGYILFRNLTRNIELAAPSEAATNMSLTFYDENGQFAELLDMNNGESTVQIQAGPGGQGTVYGELVVLDSDFVEVCSDPVDIEVVQYGEVLCGCPRGDCQSPADEGLRPSAEDGAGPCNSINLFSGEKRLHETDLTIPGRGMDYEFRRVYRSQASHLRSVANDDFGVDWAFSYGDDRLIEDNGNIIVHRDTLRTDVFVPTGTAGEFSAPREFYEQLRLNTHTGDYELRDAQGLVKRYRGFDDPNIPGRLIEMRDRNDNVMTFHYRLIDPDETNGVSFDAKHVLAFVVDTLGREIRYRYYAEHETFGTVQTDSADRVLTTDSFTQGDRGRLACVVDFKGDMDFDGTATSADFPGQRNNRRVCFFYDEQSNLFEVTLPAVTGTPNENDFPDGKTYRYSYLTAFDVALPAGPNRQRLLHNLIDIEHPNEANLFLAEPREIVRYYEAEGFSLDRVEEYEIAGENDNDVPAGGTIGYSYQLIDGGAEAANEPHLELTVTDRVGNVTDYVYGAGDTLLEKRERTRNLRNNEPSAYAGSQSYNEEKEGNEGESPLGNSRVHEYNTGSSDRFQQGNVIRTVRQPDPGRAGMTDQGKIENVMVYEPVYNRPCLVVYGRGADIGNNDFTPGVADPAAGIRQIADPYDPAKTIDLRYARVEFFDYQESTETAAAAPAARLDRDGSGGRVNQSPLIGVEPEVLTVQVWLVQELGLAENAAGLAELNNRLNANMTRLGLGDLNGDGIEGVAGKDGAVVPTIAGNVIRTVFGSPVLIDGSNQHALEAEIESAGDLVDESLPLMDGGTQEGIYGDRLQTIVHLYQYNRFGQMSRSISPEGNVETRMYYPEIDPDGDGHFSVPVQDFSGNCIMNLADAALLSESWLSGCSLPEWCGGLDVNQDGVVDPFELGYLSAHWLDCLAPAAADGRELATDSGGYLREKVIDDGRDYVKQGAGAGPGAAFSNNGGNPKTAAIRKIYTYDDVGNVTSVTNGRGIRSDFFVNERNQIVQTVRAADISGAAQADPVDPLVGDATGPLTAFGYIERTFYDFNDNVVLRQREDRGNTSNLDGSGLGSLPFQATETTPGLETADEAGGPAFADTLYLYDILDNRIEQRQEVNGNRALRTRSRYDGNENIVLTIYPEGNAESRVYDERDLLFQEIKGTDQRPAAGLYSFADPTSFDRPGGAGTNPSMTTYNYDLNGNLIEKVDAEYHGGTSSVIAGTGDVTRYTYDGFDRKVSTIDPLGNVITRQYDPDDNIVRVVFDGDPVDDIPGNTQNRTLAVNEYLYDSFNRGIALHKVLFATPDVTPNRAVSLTDTPAMDSPAPYLSDATNDTAGVPGAMAGLTIIGRITTRVEYDRESRHTFIVEDDLDTTRQDYDGAGRLIRTRDSAISNGFAAGVFTPGNLAGNSAAYYYDDNNNLIEKVETDVTSIADVDDEMFRTTFVYDSLDRMQRHVDNLGQTLAMRYDSRNNLAAMADASGPVTDREIERRQPGVQESITINDFGNVVRLYYDGIDRRQEIQNILTASGTGDGLHIGASLEGVKDAGGAADTPPPDSGPSEDGLVSQYSVWDDNSQIIALRDDDGNTTAYIYDNLNRRRSGVYGLSFTGADLFPAVTAPDSGRVSDMGTFNTALRNQVLSDPPQDTENNGTEEQYSYDRDSNLISGVDEAGNQFTYQYDALNRRKSCDIVRALGFIGTTQQNRLYDGLSRETHCFDNNDPFANLDDLTCTYAYDSLSRPIEKTQQIGATGPVRVISRNYDIAAGGSTKHASGTIYPDGREISQSYDGVDRLRAKADAGFNALVTFDYLGRHRAALRTYQNGTRLTHIGQDEGSNVDTGYDGLRRTIAHRWEKSDAQPPGDGSLLVGFGHQFASGAPAYDRMNNKLIEEKLHDTGNSEVYGYDSLYRLRTFERGELNPAKKAAASLTATAGAVQQQSWELDGMGNWIAVTHTVADVGETEEREHSDYNEIYEITGMALPGSAAGLNYFDKNGNLLDDGIRTIAWDALNRPRHIRRQSDNQLVGVYSYDCHGRRFRKTVTNGGIPGDPALNGTTEFYYDRRQVIEERDGTGQVLRQYVYGNYIDEPLVMDQRLGGVSIAQLNDQSGGQRLFYHGNALYSIYALSDETGTLAEGYQYDAYGRPTVFEAGGNGAVDFGGDDVIAAHQSGSSGNPYLFTGRRFDAESGLHYARRRYYNPSAGRFISRDPKGYVDGLNLYEFARSRPGFFVDPMGLDCLTASEAWDAYETTLRSRLGGSANAGGTLDQRAYHHFHTELATMTGGTLSRTLMGKLLEGAITAPLSLTKDVIIECTQQVLEEIETELEGDDIGAITDPSWGLFTVKDETLFGVVVRTENDYPTSCCYETQVSWEFSDREAQGLGKVPVITVRWCYCEEGGEKTYRGHHHEIDWYDKSDYGGDGEEGK